MGADGVLPGRLLPAALRSLESWTGRARSGCADRFPQPPLLLLLHRAVAAGGLLLHRALDPRGLRAVPDERAGRTDLVRLSLPADRLDRPVLCGRALGGRRSPRTDEGRRGPPDRQTAR